jgi:23S rRNA pseudouridine1911/1915/1917 synthase
MPESGVRRERFVAAGGDAGRRLDQFLLDRLPDLSRARIQRLIRDGHVRVPRGAVKPGLAVRTGLVVDVEVPPPVPASPEPEPLALAILHDDEAIAVIDKPAGVVVHPGAGHARGTLVNALLHHLTGLSGVGGTERPGIVHRLDRGTSGVLVVAKHDRAHRDLARQFHDRTVAKEYVALVWGAPRAGTVLDQPIGRHPRHRRKMSARAPRGRAAVTRIVDVEPLGGVSLVRVTIGTGRTHQIRVHLSEAGHPVVGDALYGGVRRRLPARLAPLAGLERPFLHAARITFRHPDTGRPATFAAPLPPDLLAPLAALRQSAPAGRTRKVSA